MELMTTQNANAPALMHYQQVGAKFLSERKRALLADQMRLGKTPQAIAAADKLAATKITVVCPACAVTNWVREWRRFSGDHNTIYVPPSRLKTKEDKYAFLHSRVVVTSYPALTASKPLRRAFLRRRVDVLINDESHFLKTYDSTRTVIVYGGNGLMQNPSLGSTADYVWNLSGTPAPNNASELYTNLRAFGLIPPTYRFSDFVGEYCTGKEGAYGFKILGSKNQQRLLALWQGNFLRRRIKDVEIELPPIRTAVRYVEGAAPATPKAEHDAQLLATLSPDDIDAWMQSNADSYAEYRRFTGLAKVGGVIEIVVDALLDTDQKIVVFAYHREVLDQLYDKLRGVAVLYHGGVSKGTKENAVNRFREDPKVRVFLGQIVACGVAIDLSTSNYVLMAEQDWVPGNNQQALMRIHGLRQTKPCIVEFVSLAGGIDEVISEAQARKTRDIEKFLGDDNATQNRT